MSLPPTSTLQVAQMASQQQGSHNAGLFTLQLFICTGCSIVLFEMKDECPACHGKSFDELSIQSTHIVIRKVK